MKSISNYFDYIDFTDSDIESWIVKTSSENTLDPEISPNVRVEYWQIIIAFYKIGLVPGHPLNEGGSEMIFLPKCICIFDDVKKSVQKITDYVEEPPGSNKFVPIENEPPRVEEQENKHRIDKPVTLFELEGMDRTGRAWFDWEIESASFSLEVDPQDIDRAFTLSEYIASIKGDSPCGDPARDRSPGQAIVV